MTAQIISFAKWIDKFRADDERAWAELNQIAEQRKLDMLKNGVQPAIRENDPGFKGTAK